MPSLERMFQSELRVPVVVFERKKKRSRLAQLLHLHNHKLLFVGRVPVRHILLMGQYGVTLLYGSRLMPEIEKAVTELLEHTNLRGDYSVVDWLMSKKRLLVYVQQIQADKVQIHEN